MLKTSKLVLASTLSALLSCGAFAGTQSTSSSTTNTKPPIHADLNAGQTPARKTAPTSYTLSMSQDCAGGGTRAIEGAFDATSGALSMTTTLTACALRNGDTLDGKASTAGTLLVDTDGADIDIVANVDTTVNRADGSSVAHICTTTKKGHFDETTKTFDGTTTRNQCSVTGKVREHENMIEHILRAAFGGEDGGGDPGQRMMPPQTGEDKFDDHPKPQGQGQSGSRGNKPVASGGNSAGRGTGASPPPGLTKTR